jgi:16S rRNA (cytosine1402-N4)-methyltransferase
MVYHIPAMPVEAIRYLACRPKGIYVDATLGGAGHAERICEASAPDGILIGIDQDADAVAHARDVLARVAGRVHLFNANFVHLPALLAQLHIAAVDGILVDLGLSLHQIDASGRGFSFQRDEPLDMRMDTGSAETAADIVNRESEVALARIFREYGEERWAKRIARRVVETRRSQPIRTSGRLVSVIAAAVPPGAARRQKIHPATRVFMALRIAVNRELERLDAFLDAAVAHLNPGGRLCVLSFHSLEDRMVKHRFQALAAGCTCPPSFPRCVCNRQPAVRLLTRKVVRPQPEEVRQNPRARSTRLRAVERI